MRYQVVGPANTDDAEKSAMFLHGAMSVGDVWKPLVARLRRDAPNVRCVLVDLRGHGGSVGLEGPNSLRQCGADLHALTQMIGVPDVLVGHSLGGKIAIEYMARWSPHVPNVFLLDSPLGRVDRSGLDQVLVELFRLLSAIRAVGSFPSRADMQQHLLDYGVDPSTARWMTHAATERHSSDAVGWHVDPKALNEIVSDSWDQDLNADLEAVANASIIHMVIGEDSKRWTDVERSRLDAFVRASTVQLSIFRKAGHLVHIDRPDALVSLLHGVLVSGDDYLG